MIPSATILRLGHNLAANIITAGDGRDHIDRLAIFSARHELDLEDHATLARLAAGEGMGPEAIQAIH